MKCASSGCCRFMAGIVLLGACPQLLAPLMLMQRGYIDHQIRLAMVLCGLATVCVSSFDSCATVRRSAPMLTAAILMTSLVLLAQVCLAAYTTSVLQGPLDTIAADFWAILHASETPLPAMPAEVVGFVRLNLSWVLGTSLCPVALLLPCLAVFWRWRTILIRKNVGVFDAEKQFESVRSRNHQRFQTSGVGSENAATESASKQDRDRATQERKAKEKASRAKRVEELVTLMEETREKASK